MGIPKSEDDNEGNEIDEVGGVNGKEKSKSKGEAPEGFRSFFALDFAAEPKKESGPKNKHDERGAGAGKVEEGGRKNGKNGGEQGDVVFEPTVKKQNQEEAEGETDENGRKFNSVRRETEGKNGEFLENVVRKIDEVAASDRRKMEIITFYGGGAFGVGEAGGANQR